MSGLNMLIMAQKPAIKDKSAHPQLLLDTSTTWKLGLETGNFVCDGGTHTQQCLTLSTGALIDVMPFDFLPSFGCYIMPKSCVSAAGLP